MQKDASSYVLLIVVALVLHPNRACGGQRNDQPYVPCPSGWATYPGSPSCYKWLPTKANWFSARKACLSMGGDLVTIGSQKENDFVSYLAMAYSPTALYIGLMRDLHNNFKWVDGTPLNGQYSSWNKGEPNSIQEGCAVMYSRKTYLGLWNDVGCLKLHTLGYVCEKEKC